MKTVYGIIIMLVIPITLTKAQSFSEKITREFSFETKSSGNALMIANVNGEVKVQAYEGEKILVEITKSIRAKTQARLDQGKEGIQLGVKDLADTIILYVSGTCNQFGKITKGNRGNWSKKFANWGYNWCNDRNCREEVYDYTMDFTVKVPAQLNVMISTINDGNLLIENVKVAVIAHNINGSVKLTNLESGAEASTINGDVDITYARNPQKDCRFYSLNGDINAIFQKNLSANFGFESFNGSFYTDIGPIEALPVKVEKSEKGEGIKYKVNGNRYKIRSGGPYLDFETFNGDVYVKEK